MAAGDPTLTDHGVFEISGAALKTKVDSLSPGLDGYQSGAGLHFIPVANGMRINLLEVKIA